MNTPVLITMVAIAVVSFIVLMLILARSGEKAGYESCGNLFTPAEKTILGVLEQALDSHYRIFGKVRLGDLIKPVKGLAAGKWTIAMNRINQLHVDFVVCTANELALVGVLALDDQSLGYEGRTGRDGFVDQALANAGIPVLRFPAKKGYAVQEVRARQVEMLFAGSKAGIVSSAQNANSQFNPDLDATIMDINPVQSDPVADACPKCSAAMVKRQVVGG